MRILVIGLIAICFGVGLWYYFMRTPQVKNVPMSLSGPILFFGDSLVQGTGSTKGNDLPMQLSRALGEPVLNFGVPGDTTRKSLERLESALAEQPRLVLILLGGNDFIQRVPRDETFSNLKLLITTFQSSGAAVVLFGVRSSIMGGGADDRFERLAGETQSLYVEDVLQDIFGNPSLMSDAIHPNDAGYQKIVDRIVPLLKPMIDAR